MGEVIFFRRSERPARPRGTQAATAQILFFTGVRYERMTDAPRTNNKRPSVGGLGAKRRRKRG